MSGKRFAVFDIDGTLVRWQLYHAIADNLVKLGFLPTAKYKAIIDARMAWKRRQGGESFKAYELELVNLYQDMLSQITVEQFNKAAEAVFEEYKDQVYTYTRDLIAKLKDKGYLLLAISGSQQQIISKMADYYGFDGFTARVDKYKGQKFTGKSSSPVFDKAAALNKLVAEHQAGFAGSIAVGDSFSDVAMLELVEKPIAFNPEKSLFEHAKKNGWNIVIERKNMIYQLKAKDGKYQLA